jgi:cobalt transporter subunit CbtB
MTTTAPAISVASLSLSQRVLVGLATLFLGVVLVGGIGFASDMAVHNGAHDTRHALGFPCH